MWLSKGEFLFLLVRNYLWNVTSYNFQPRNLIELLNNVEQIEDQYYYIPPNSCDSDRFEKCSRVVKNESRKCDEDQRYKAGKLEQYKWSFSDQGNEPTSQYQPR